VKSNYKSLRHFRHAANERSSFYSTLTAISRCSAFDLQDARATGVSRSGHKRRAATSPPPTNRDDTEDNGPGITLASAPITGATPKRKVMHQYQDLSWKDSAALSDEAYEVLERRVNCPGTAIYSKQDARGQCAVCRQECYSMCVLCHTYCHDNRIYPGAEDDEFEIHIPSANDNDNGKTLHVQNTCFWYLHKDGFKNKYGK
jgi:hypothetical protein